MDVGDNTLVRRRSLLGSLSTTLPPSAAASAAPSHPHQEILRGGSIVVDGGHLSPRSRARVSLADKVPAAVQASLMGYRALDHKIPRKESLSVSTDNPPPDSSDRGSASSSPVSFLRRLQSRRASEATALQLLKNHCDELEAELEGKDRKIESLRDVNTDLEELASETKRELSEHKEVVVQSTEAHAEQMQTVTDQLVKAQEDVIRLKQAMIGDAKRAEETIKTIRAESERYKLEAEQLKEDWKDALAAERESVHQAFEKKMAVLRADKEAMERRCHSALQDLRAERLRAERSERKLSEIATGKGVWQDAVVMKPVQRLHEAIIRFFQQVGLLVPGLRSLGFPDARKYSVVDEEGTVDWMKVVECDQRVLSNTVEYLARDSCTLRAVAVSMWRRLTRAVHSLRSRSPYHTAERQLADALSADRAEWTAKADRLRQSNALRRSRFQLRGFYDATGVEGASAIRRSSSIRGRSRAARRRSNSLFVAMLEKLEGRADGESSAEGNRWHGSTTSSPAPETLHFQGTPSFSCDTDDESAVSHRSRATDSPHRESRVHNSIQGDTSTSPSPGRRKSSGGSTPVRVGCTVAEFMVTKRSARRAPSVQAHQSERQQPARRRSAADERLERRESRSSKVGYTQLHAPHEQDAPPQSPRFLPAIVAGMPLDV